MYLAQTSRAEWRMRVSIALPAASTAGLVGARGGFAQALVILGREFGVDRQPQRSVFVGPGQANGEFDPLVAARPDLDIALVLLDCQHLGENAAQRDLGPGAARLNVAQHPLQIADPGSQGLHLAHTLEHLFELVADQLEAGAEPVLECFVQLFVDRDAHRFELFGVVDAQRLQPALDRALQRLAEPDHRAGDFLAQLPGFLGGEPPAARQLVAQALVEAGERRLDRRLAAAALRAGAQQHRDPGGQNQPSQRERGKSHPGQAHPMPSTRPSGAISPPSP